MVSECSDGQEHSNPIEYHSEGVALCEPFLSMDSLITALQHQDLPVPVSIKTEPGTGWSCVSDVPEHGRPVGLVECISGINQ